ncbi:uncharacterized protein LOC130809221 [Amaranthus tricolor]|uniref:uncharacterized protein LOC130809221 n=1 Tax=Amaranthus tricolor TaxID=29722 RepID=UPI0025831ABD|nr:uncharacterized protein LOC130809221 [Amaranthus tricolor]
METIRAAWHTNLPGSPTQLDRKLRLIKEEDVHLHPGDKHLTDVECSKIEAYRRLKREREAGLRQKAKLKWLTLGDDNTRYFHHSLQHRRKCSTINVLNFQDRTTGDPREIQVAFEEYYLALLGGKMKERARTKDAMWSIPEDKASGLNGLNSGFYKAAWDIVGADVVRAI